MRVWLELVKPRIALAAAASSLAVFVLAGSGLGGRTVALGLGVFLLGCGAAALNQLLERRLDGLMERTHRRPMPSGRLRPSQALLAALLLSATGLSLISRAAGPAGGVLAVLAAAWYDGVYTPLKRVTAFAVVPGALVGAVPPVLGWLAAGRPWQDPRLLCLCFFFYLWQVPHFWLLVPRYGPDLERAGLPNLGRVLGAVRLARLTAVWMSVAAASVLLLPIFGVVGSAATFVLLAAAAWLTGQAVRLMRAASGEGGRQSFGDDAPWRAAFAQLNAFVLGVMALLACDPFLARLSLRP